MIAMALACNPSLVIADEPTTALDVMVQAQVLQLLKGLQHDLGLAMLFITHDLSVLVEVADRIAIMYAGQIVEEGPAEAVFHEPAHPYTKALAGAFPEIGDARFRGKPSGLGGDPPDPQHIPSGCPFHPRCAEAVDGCPTLDVELWEAGDDRRAACVHVSGAPGTLGGDGSERHDDRATPVRVSGAPLIEVRGLEVSFSGRSSLLAGCRRRPRPSRRRSTASTSCCTRARCSLSPGESGCGKTTTARAIMGLIRPNGGDDLLPREAARHGSSRPTAARSRWSSRTRRRR